MTAAPTVPTAPSVHAPVSLRTRDGRTAAGIVSIERRDDRARWRRALRGGGILAAAGVACLPLPLVHLVATPVLWIAAVVVFLRRLTDRTVVTGGGGPCPACAARIDVETGVRPEWPAVAVCSSCRRSVELAPAPDAATVVSPGSFAAP